jgi:hypothetical protein
MPNAPTSKAVLAVPTVGDQWHQKRVNRKLDGRDQVLEEAIQLLEERDSAVYPVITAVRGFNPSKGAAGTDVVVLLSGLCTASSTVTCSIGATAIPTPAAGTNQVTLPAAEVDAAVDAATLGDLLTITLRVDNMFCPSVILPAVTT